MRWHLKENEVTSYNGQDIIRARHHVILPWARIGRKLSWGREVLSSWFCSQWKNFPQHKMYDFTPHLNTYSSRVVQELYVKIVLVWRFCWMKNLRILRCSVSARGIPPASHNRPGSLQWQWGWGVPTVLAERGTPCPRLGYPLGRNSDRTGVHPPPPPVDRHTPVKTVLFPILRMR